MSLWELGGDSFFSVVASTEARRLGHKGEYGSIVISVLCYGGDLGAILCICVCIWMDAGYI